MPCSFGSRECYGPWIQGWTEPALISSLMSHSHYPKPTSIFTQILYREGCTNQDISVLLSAPSHLWLLWFTLALRFPRHKSSLLKNRARLQRRHLPLYFLLWARSGNVSSGVLHSDLSAKMFTASNPPSRMLWEKERAVSLLLVGPSTSQGLRGNRAGSQTLGS